MLLSVSSVVWPAPLLVCRRSARCSVGGDSRGKSGGGEVLRGGDDGTDCDGRFVPPAGVSSVLDRRLSASECWCSEACLAPPLQTPVLPSLSMTAPPAGDSDTVPGRTSEPRMPPRISVSDGVRVGRVLEDG
eukprot:m.579713 g.579713  ORF g.579713 m.579713 type:complete len:132 (-) comp22317_c0_seq2:180-575(-)